ncbi:uncharacterized protein LOC119090431 isoform X2 [Pollicipes pollicipes]|uniref:uncharacterized protein LOC119090431 isoform X2 n=1 Tax=Pollicipes pollicipes TaxID=41117 RepID=UPI0018852020|nr:uncharacterized protein LOC119090431 isoform X2 [Pollicipes pollicipes]
MVRSCGVAPTSESKCNYGSLEPASTGSLDEEVRRSDGQQWQLFRETMAQIRRTNADLLAMREQAQTMEVRHSEPWTPELAGQELLLVDEEAWQEYVRKYLYTAPAVRLPPVEEIDIDKLVTRLTGPHDKMLPPPGRTCYCGFYPSLDRSRLPLNQPRLKALTPGARIPNTVIIRILWCTRTLLDVEHYRKLANERSLSRQRWEPLERDESEDGECLARTEDLEATTDRRRHRYRIVFPDNEHVEEWPGIAADGANAASVDSEDAAIARERQWGAGRHGELLSDAEGAPVPPGEGHSALDATLATGAVEGGALGGAGVEQREDSAPGKSAAGLGEGSAPGRPGETGWRGGSAVGAGSADQGAEKEQRGRATSGQSAVSGHSGEGSAQKGRAVGQSQDEPRAQGAFGESACEVIDRC